MGCWLAKSQAWATHPRRVTSQGEHRVKLAVAAVLITMTAPCMAQDYPPLHSLWRETQHYGWCLEITGILEPLPGSGDCIQISGSLNKGGLVSGYACTRGSIINFFSGIESDNSIGPDILIGTYDSESLSIQYCTRLSNDWPPDYNCEHGMKFDHVTSCNP